MKQFTARQALLIIVAVFVALTPFARTYIVPWTIPVALVLGAFLLLCWKRFPEWQRQSDIKSAAAEKAFADLQAEFGTRAVVKWCILIFVSLAFGMAVMSLGVIYNSNLAFAMGAVLFLGSYMWFAEFSPVARRHKELYKASLQSPPNGPSSP